VTEVTREKEQFLLCNSQLSCEEQILDGRMLTFIYPIFTETRPKSTCKMIKKFLELMLYV